MLAVACSTRRRPASGEESIWREFYFNIFSVAHLGLTAGLG